MEHENKDRLISIFKIKIKAMTDWCSKNKLDINWTNTYFMFITNKRISLPKTIVIEDSKIEVLQKFKLLGVTIDSKLNFTNCHNEIKILVTRKMNIIKRLFIYICL